MSVKNFLKPFFEFMPLCVFFGLNSYTPTVMWGGEALNPIFVATGGFMIATGISLAGMYAMMRQIPMMPLISGVFVMFFGGLTLFLQDDTFIKIKPTLNNILFGSILLIGLYYNRLFLKMILSEAIQLHDDGWRLLTFRWGFFFFVLAGLNECVWRFFTTDQWVTFKTFGVMPLTLIFTVLQAGLIHKYQIQQENSDA